jgi:hypothetical protein
MATELVFNARVDTGNSAEEVESLNTQLEETNDLAAGVGNESSKSTNKASKAANKLGDAYKSPAARLEELRNRMVELGTTGGAEFQGLAREAGQLQDDINNVNAAVTAASSDFPALEVGIQAMTSIGAAAQGATAAQALFGSENEDVARSIQKLVAIQGLMNSVQMIANNLSDESALGIRLRAIQTSVLTTITQAQTVATAEATVTQRILNTVMKANPVFLLITAFTALAAAIAVFAASSKDARTQQELLNEAQDESLATIGEETAKLDDLTAVLKSETASRNQKREAIEELNKAYPEFLGNIDLEKATQEELNEAIEKQTKLITLQAEAKALAAIKADLFKEKIELELEATREATGAWVMFTDAIGAGTSRQLKDDLARQQRIGTLNEEIESINSATEANREEEASLLGVADAQALATQLSDAFTKSQEDNAATVNKLAKEREAERKKASADREKEESQEAKLRMERGRLVADFLIASQEDENVRKLMALKEGHKRERKALEEKYKGDTALMLQLDMKQSAELQAQKEEIRKSIEEGEKAKRDEEQEREFTNKKARLEAELIQLGEDAQARMSTAIELSELERDQALADEGITEGEKLKIVAEFDKKKGDILKAAAIRDKELNGEIQRVSVEQYRAGIDAIANLSNVIFDIKKSNLEKGSAAEEQAAKKQFKINKALQLSGAIIDGVKAISASLAQSPIAIGTAPNPAGIASLAFAAVTSAANIAKIAASRFQSIGGGGSVGAPSVPSIPDANTGDAETGDFGDGNTTLTGGDQGTTQAAPMRVAVVDSDIKVALDNSERVEVTSSIG